MELWIGAVNLGFLFSFMALGVYITYKIYDFPDITVDGSFTTGAAVASVLIIGGMNPFLAVLFSFLAGALAGMITGIIHTRFKINGLLSGILVMTGLYSVNLRIMGKSNIPMIDFPVFSSAFEKMNPGMNSEAWLCICLLAVTAVFWILLSLFFRTDFGITMRATGDNPVMVSASGINVDYMKVFGIALANGLTGTSGALVAQYQGFSDIGMGVGSIVFSMASVIIGEALIKKRSAWAIVLSVIIGSVIFRLMIALALFVGLNPNDLKIITAFFVFLTLVVSGAFGIKRSVQLQSLLKKNSRLAYAAFVLLAIAAGYLLFTKVFVKEKKITTIGIIMPNDAEILTLTRDGFLSEMKKIGYEEGKNIHFIEQNANGDIPTVSTIVDNYINQKVDIFLPISTVSTQAAVKKIKETPVIFATVANPFVIGVGKTDSVHPANITGVYGTAPIKQMLGVLKQFYPGKIKIGAIWNAAYPNSVNNLEALKKNLAKEPDITLEGATISSSADVYQAAQSLSARGIDVFFLIPDLTLYAAFESVVKISRDKKIPIFMNDAEKLKSGAMVVYGYDYYSSGRQAAHIVDRVLKGEKTAGIPYEKHKRITFGINYDEAAKLNIKVPEAAVKNVNAVVKDGKLVVY
ncbi:MAG: ABC transporter substrate binding protein [Syntrophothermus sp.]